MDTRALMESWAIRCRAVAGKALEGTAAADATAHPHARQTFVETFQDEIGNRRRVDRPFLSALLGLEADSSQKPDRLDLDDRLWWAVHNRDQPILEFGPGGGPLDPDLNEVAIETRTETELAAIHALVRLGLDRDEPSMIERALDAAAWQVRELQPDNATNHPWAIHVFVLLAAHRDDDGGALLHAQTLLHNCQVSLGRADRFSACVLLDAANELDRLA